MAFVEISLVGICLKFRCWWGNLATEIWTKQMTPRWQKDPKHHGLGHRQSNTRLGAYHLLNACTLGSAVDRTGGPKNVTCPGSPVHIRPEVVR